MNTNSESNVALVEKTEISAQAVERGQGDATPITGDRDEIIFKNQEDLKWEKMLPDLGDDSPLFAVLRVDPKTQATTLMIQFPKAIHIPRHIHEKSETHIILGGSHIFEDTASGKRIDVREQGYIYMPGKFVHEAWVPAGSKAVIILEGGWKVDWLEGAPTVKDLGQGAPLPSAQSARS